MLAKLTSENQLTLPKALLGEFPACDYFDVTKENGRIVLTPVRLTRACCPPSENSWLCTTPPGGVG